MMSRLPSVRPAELIRALERAGFTTVRIVGSHYHLRNMASGIRVTVPVHRKEMRRATLMAIIKQAGLTPDDLAKLL